MGLLDSLRRLFRRAPAKIAPPQPPSGSEEERPVPDLPASIRDLPEGDGMRHRVVRCLAPSGLHRMAYTEWGDPANPKVLVCVHGLTRNARDFDHLANAMKGEYRVICPDVAGRGRSDWLKDPSEYGFPQYLADMVTLIARLDVETIHWVGTSMGGLIGMMLAAKPGSPISRLVLNDVGPLITGASLKRIASYVGQTTSFANFREAEAHIRETCAPFGELSARQWHLLTLHSVRAGADRLWLRYDPAIAEPFRKAFVGVDVNLWPIYDDVRCPTLVVRGAESDLLTHQTAEEMTRRGPKAGLVEIPGVGHAPMFLGDDQVAPVRAFLLEEEPAQGAAAPQV